MIRRFAQQVWNEPRVPDAPRRVWRDWVIAGVIIPGSIAEMAFREAAGWKPGAIVISFALAAAVLYRRVEPLKAVAFAFGSIIALDYVSRLYADQPLEFYTASIVLIIPYALFRWGSGREAVYGFGIMMIAYVHFNYVDWTGVGDAIGGFFVLLFPTAAGEIVRSQGRSRSQLMARTKLLEREQLARELHDTVAHHVSAIAIQAQAGRAVAATHPDAAIQALTTIEEEASRTLIEMRTMVSALRAGEAAELAPQAAFHDIERLAESSTHLPVTVERHGDLDELSPPVDRALFRLAQESITNATRHAKNATGVTVRVIGESDEVRLLVSDDGERRAFDPANSDGFGLVGMAERAALLGGTLDAGPNPRRGWTVQAVLPKTGAST